MSLLNEEQQEKDDLDLFIKHPFFYNLTIKRMLRMINNPVEKFVFCFVYLLDFKQKDAADVLNVNETNISRHITRIRKRLWYFNKDCKENKQEIK